MTAPNFLSWENFRTTILIRGQQRVHLVTSSPLIEIFSDGDGNRTGIWIEVSAETVLPAELLALETIKTCTLVRGGKTLLEVATSATSLQRQFYHFAEAVAERVIVEKRPAVDAACLELRCFTDLLEEKPLLGIERQLGLLGELLFLERLAAKMGSRALDAWLGPAGEPHDFRLLNREFEIKTTVATRRMHTIHGMEQLVPSVECSLFLVSVMLGPPGADNGFSLADKVSELEKLFAEKANRLKQFEQALDACGYRVTDAVHYGRKFAARRSMAIVPVTKSFPSITRPIVQGALGSLAVRIQTLQYEVNVEGLEHEEGSASFEAAISV